MAPRKIPYTEHLAGYLQEKSGKRLFFLGNSQLSVRCKEFSWAFKWHVTTQTPPCIAKGASKSPAFTAHRSIEVRGSAVRQSILARILCFVCVCVCVYDSCVGLLCSSHAMLPFVVLLRCNHRTLQVRRVFSRNIFLRPKPALCPASASVCRLLRAQLRPVPTA